MKKSYLAVPLALLLTMGTSTFAMASEISTEPVPYRPDIKVEAPSDIDLYALHYLCQVTGVDEGSSLNVRSEPSPSGKIIGSFAPNAVIYCEYMGDHTDSDDYWYAHGKDKSTGKTIYGYVSVDYVTCTARAVPHTEQ